MHHPPAMQGATGFGSAILHSLVWVVFSSAGVDGGSLPLSVTVECVCSVALAVPLLFLVDAFRTGDLSIVVAIVALQVLMNEWLSAGGDEGCA